MFNRYHYYIKLVIILGRLPGRSHGYNSKCVIWLNSPRKMHISVSTVGYSRQTITLGYHVGTMWAWMWYSYELAQQGPCVCSRYFAGTFMGCETKQHKRVPCGLGMGFGYTKTYRATGSVCSVIGRWAGFIWSAVINTILMTADQIKPAHRPITLHLRALYGPVQPCAPVRFQNSRRRHGGWIVHVIDQWS